jgi:hypothetical protein
MLGGALDDDERKYLFDKHYVEGHKFTPLKTSDGVWILPLYQIYNNENIDCWWVKYLPIVEYKH